MTEQELTTSQLLLSKKANGHLDDAQKFPLLQDIHLQYKYNLKK